MNGLPYDSLKALPMPLDKVNIKTNIPLKEDCLEYYMNFQEKLVGLLRNYGAGSMDQSSGQTITMQLVSGALDLKVHRASQGDTLYLTDIHINPSKLITGHNGYLTSAFDVLTVFGTVRESLRPMLARPNDDVLLIPGLKQGGPSYWHDLEIPAHLLDPDGELLLAFRNAKHESIRKVPFGYENESSKLKARRGEVGIIAYRKDLEMEKKLKKEEAPEQDPILRVEVFLDNEKLVDYLDHPGNTELIDGRKRVVRFSPAHLIAAHKRIMSEIQGTFFRRPEKKDKAKTPNFLALVSKMAKVPLPDLFELYQQAASPEPRTMQTIKRKAYTAVSALSDLNVDDLFTPEAYSSTRGIYIPAAQTRYEEHRDSGTIDRDVMDAYGPREATAPDVTAPTL